MVLSVRGRVGDHQIGGKWIQAPLHAFNGGIKAFQINGNIGIGQGGRMTQTGVVRNVP